MDLARYDELTGTSTPSSKANKVTASVERCRATLETMLGFTLDSEKTETNLYTEIGKLPNGDWHSVWELDFSALPTLDDPDEIVGAYRQFEFNPSDRYLHLDPFSGINAVKLVKDGVTLTKLDTDDYRVVTEAGGVTRYLELRYGDDFVHAWRRHAGMQLAIDADWLWSSDEEGQVSYPDDLLYAWADMVEFHSSSSKQVKSESRGTRSYTKFDATSPFESKATLDVVRRYAGPGGSVSRMPV